MIIKCERLVLDAHRSHQPGEHKRVAKIEVLGGDSRMECTLDPTLMCMGLLLLPWSRIVWEVRYSSPSSGVTVKVAEIIVQIHIDMDVHSLIKFLTLGTNHLWHFGL